MADEGTFKVVDRRKFMSDGTPRPEGEVPPEEKKLEPPPPPPPKQEAAPPDEAPYEPGTETAFERLILSFTQTAMLQLGLAALEPGQPLEPDLPGARDTIDMLAVLEEKTRGNLTAREARLLNDTLTELRLAFVGVQKRIIPR